MSVWARFRRKREGICQGWSVERSGNGSAASGWGRSQCRFRGPGMGVALRSEGLQTVAVHGSLGYMRSQLILHYGNCKHPLLFMLLRPQTLSRFSVWAPRAHSLSRRVAPHCRADECSPQWGVSLVKGPSSGETLPACSPVLCIGEGSKAAEEGASVLRQPGGSKLC